MAGEYLTSLQVARLLGISKRTVLNAVTAGDLRAVYRMPGGAYRFKAPDVERYAEWRVLKHQVEEQARAVVRTQARRAEGRSIAAWADQISTISKDRLGDAGTEIGDVLALLAGSLQVGAALVTRSEDGAWPIAYVHDRAGMGLRAGVLLPWGELFAHAMGSGSAASLIVEDVRTDARLSAIADLPLSGVGSLTAVPMFTAGGQLYGALCTLHPSTRPVPSGELSTMRLAGRMVVQALEAAALRERERRDAQRAAQLAAIVEHSGEAIFRMSSSGLIETWNAGATHLYGYSAEEAIGRSVGMLEPSDRAGEQSHLLQQLRHGQDVVDFETVRLRKDGTSVDVSLTISAIVDGAGNLIDGSVIARNNGDRVRMRRAQCEEAEEAEAMAAVGVALAGTHESAQVYAVILDQAARLLPFDLANVTLFEEGWAVIAASGGVMPLAAGTRHVTLDGVERYWMAPRGDVYYLPDTGDEPSWHDIPPHVGNCRIRSQISMPLDLDGLQVGCFSVGSYIPHAYNDHHLRIARAFGERAAQALRNARLHESELARAQAAEALQESEQKYRLLAENSTDMIARLMPDLTFLYVSPAARQLLGFDPNAAVGRLASEFIHPEDREAVEQALLRLKAGPVSEALAYRHLRSDGTYIWLESTGHAIRDERSGEVIELQVASRDVTARKQAEDALREVARDRAEQAAVAEALAEVSAALAGVQEPEALYASLLQVMARVVPCTTAHIFAYRDGWAVVAGAYGAQCLAVGAQVTRLDDAEECFPQSEDQARPQPKTHGASGCEQGAPGRNEHETRNTIILPLFLRGEAYGCLNVDCATAGEYTERHFAMVKAFAERIGQALWNARLYQLEQERALAAENLASLRNDFIASVSHELRTPLTAVLGYAEMLDGHWSRLTDAQRSIHLRRIVAAANRQKRLDRRSAAGQHL